MTQKQHGLNETSFSDAYLKGVDLSHQDALVVTLQVGNFEMKMIRINPGQRLI